MKVDFAKDVTDLIQPRGENGIASIDDLYYRKMLAVIGWKAGESKAGTRWPVDGRKPRISLMFIICPHT